MAKAASETSKSGGKRRKSAAANGRRFEDDTLEAMRLVKASLTKLVKAISPDLARPIDLQKRLQLDSKLCWQVFNILRDKTMLASAQHVPSMTSLKRLFAGAMKQGVSPELVEAVTGAVNEFNYVVDSHAPDRPAFDSMVAAATAGDSDSRTDLWHRRNAFRSESHIWGVQVETFISVVFIRPSADGQGKDECTLSVRLGHRRLRPSATIVVHRSSTGVATEFLPASSALPLDPGANATFHAPLLPEFCSSPVPELRRGIADERSTQIELSGTAVGRKSSVDLVFGHQVHNVPFSMDDQGRRSFRQSTRFVTPAALFYGFVLVHRPSYGAVNPTMIIHSKTDVATGHPPTPNQILPVHCEVESFGNGAAGLVVEEYPRMEELVRYACKILNWNLWEFDVYRSRITYPILHSVARMAMTLPTEAAEELPAQG